MYDDLTEWIYFIIIVSVHKIFEDEEKQIGTNYEVVALLAKYWIIKPQIEFQWTLNSIYIYIFYRTTLHRSPSFYKFNLHADQSSGSNRHERHFNFHSLRATTNTPPFFIKFHLHTQRQITRAIRQICISKHYPNSISLDHQRTPFSNSIARSEWIFCLEAKRQRKFNQRYLIPVSNIVTKFYTSPFSYAIYI